METPKNYLLFDIIIIIINAGETTECNSPQTCLFISYKDFSSSFTLILKFNVLSGVCRFLGIK